jgi:hypothetical protein
MCDRVKESSLVSDTVALSAATALVARSPNAKRLLTSEWMLCRTAFHITVYR